MLLEQFAEVAVTDPHLLCDMLDGEVALERLAYAQAGTVDHVYLLLVLAEFDVSFQGVHHADEVVDESCHDLLRVGCLFDGLLVG